ncbi:hypothetical protein ENUP19_0278G0035 [Entamoeba nuttalli]|uniref:Peptidase C1A papain C-terminal domain-containing protein n=1 Tax=Entamoeba nuttalli TaxID=412467 RepID=A0ABQ0DTM2_9EUKA
MGKETTQNLWTLWIILWSFQFLVFAVVVCSLIMLGFRSGTMEVKVINVQPIERPKQWSVPLEALTPVKNQFSRGTCWAFAAIGFLESDYRANGIRSGYLSSDEVIQFSEQAYMSLIVNYCSSHREIPLCRYGGMLENSTSNFNVDSLYYLRNVTTKYILPYSICPYQHQRGINESKCIPKDKSLNEYVENNPIKFTIRDIVTVYSISDIKKLMMKTLSPLTYGLNTEFNTMLFPCNKYNSMYSSDECKYCKTPCGSGCCTKISSSMYHKDGMIDLSVGSVRRAGHSMLVVGWNDEFPVERNRYSSPPIYTTAWNAIDNKAQTKLIKNNIEIPVDRWTKGGLILKNSYGEHGHTLGYFLQNHSLLNEDTICPLSIHPSRYYPLDVECIKRGNSFMNCSNDKLRKVSDGKIFYGATILKCKNDLGNDYAKNLGFEECGTNKDYRYALSMEWFNVTFKRGVCKTREMGDGLIVYLARWVEGKMKETITEVHTQITSWDFIAQLFEMDTTIKNSEHCGYYFQPYDTIEYLISMYQHDGFESYGFSYYGIKWEQESYYKSSKRKGQFTEINKSTKKFVTPQFDGPFGGRIN